MNASLFNLIRPIVDLLAGQNLNFLSGINKYVSIVSNRLVADLLNSVNVMVGVLGRSGCCNRCSPIHADLVGSAYELNVISAVGQLGVGNQLLLQASHNASAGSYVLQLGAVDLGNLNLIVGAILEVDAYLPSDVLAAQSGLCIILDISDISYGRGGSCSFISVNNNAAYDNEVILVARRLQIHGRP